MESFSNIHTYYASIGLTSLAKHYKKESKYFTR